MGKKKEYIQIAVGLLGALLGLCALILCNQYIMPSLPLAIRMILSILLYWLIAAVPITIMLFNKEKPSDYGFTKENISKQILVGILIGLAFSLVLTLLPHIIGLGDYVNNGKEYTELWQFAYEFVYCIFAVGFAEELVFRGFFYKKIKSIGNDTATIIISSFLFGLFHLFAGNIIQMIMTAVLGFIWCLCKEKIKYCSILSLAIAHGVYDALISVFAFLFK